MASAAVSVTRVRGVGSVSRGTLSVGGVGGVGDGVGWVGADFGVSGLVSALVFCWSLLLFSLALGMLGNFFSSFASHYR